MDPKERILSKAHELFNRYGLRSVSMDDIAAQVSMSKKTLYQYFTDKEELVGAVIIGILETNKIRCKADQKQADNAIHQLFLAFDMMQEMFEDMNPSIVYDMEKYHPSIYGAFLEHKNGFLYNMIKSNLERGVKEELYRTDFDIDILTRYRIESVMLAFDKDVFPNNRTQLVHIEQQLLEHFLHGLASSKGEKMIEKYKKQRTKKIYT